ncbi:hypothetical protein [Listeria riparia]|uniref:Uncharacterized protein n=1 Tax=Listeria riparia FSL S10-1204 TaxID=1265816 RepID=W7DF98_9LIST|nr:hypothetical protein [Listeria riparia]EUJ43993.1 hypothetical protein PRIP_11359 [Listeria riparia FSL S10-1204]
MLKKGIMSGAIYTARHWLLVYSGGEAQVHANTMENYRTLFPDIVLAQEVYRTIHPEIEEEEEIDLNGSVA